MYIMRKLHLKLKHVITLKHVIFIALDLLGRARTVILYTNKPCWSSVIKDKAGGNDFGRHKTAAAHEAEV